MKPNSNSTTKPTNDKEKTSNPTTTLPKTPAKNLQRPPQMMMQNMAHKPRLPQRAARKR